jgi:NAD(P)-dependent dehydrogenase (short-subunit alcohol dehydrogenase family)
MSGFSELAGKVAVVTGGASGIGFGLASRFAERGMHVVLADIEERRLNDAAKRIGALPIRVDVSREGDIAALAEQVRSSFGTAHVLCNNAGVGPVARISDLSISDWRWMLDVNLWGVIYGITHFLPMLKANAEGGHVINTASGSGLATLQGLAAYSASKYAVVAITEVLARELADEGLPVGATVLCPATVRTRIEESSRNRPLGERGGLTDVSMDGEFLDSVRSLMRWMDPLDVADVTIDAMAKGELYAITHPEILPMVEERFSRIRRAFEAAGKRPKG